MEKLSIDKSEFTGVFYFTNPTNEDYVHLWNNEEYTFPKMSSVPLIMPKETSEAIQEIRKRFAYDLAVREFYNSKEYKRLSKMGNGIPPTFDDKILEPMIEKCLVPLTPSRAIVRKIKSNDEKIFKASKAVGKKENLAYAFKDDVPEELGEMKE